MKRRFPWIVLAFVFAAMGSEAQAQEKRNAVAVSGSLSNQKTTPSNGGSSTTDLNVNLGYERLVVDQLSILANVALDTQSSGGSKSGTQAFEGGATYYFGAPMKAGKILPYGKGLLRYVRQQFNSGTGGGSSNANGFGLGAFVGLEHALTEGASLFDELGYERDKYKFDSGDITIKQVVLRFGLKYRF